MIYGFAPNEVTQVSLTFPDGRVEDLGTFEVFVQGGRVNAFTVGEDLGLYTIVFEGTTTRHKSIIYYKVLP